jgi:P4 family phage/plasmid primase-like protien
MVNKFRSQVHHSSTSQPGATGTTPVQSRHVPDLLKGIPQWVLWKLVPNPDRPDKPDKVPYNARTGKPASTTDRKSWCSFQAALSAYKAGGYDGLGFVPTPEHEITLFDLDRCRDPQTGALTGWAARIIKELRSYGEVTPSGEGVRVVVGGLKPDHQHMKTSGLADWQGGTGGAVEIYDGRQVNGKPGGRFLTVSGDRLDGTPAEIRKCPRAIGRIYGRHLLKPEPDRPPDPTPSGGDRVAAGGGLADAEIIALGRAEKSAKFRKLFDAGDVSGYPSASEAVAALLWKLAYYTKDREQLDRLFRRSALYRQWAGKWERLGAAEVDKAIAGVGKTSDPGHRRASSGPSVPGDVAAAERLVARYGRDLRYCREWQKWLAWTGQRWRLYADAAVMRMAIATARAELAAALVAGDGATAAWAAGLLKSRARLTAMVGIAACLEEVEVSFEDFNADPFLLNVANGTVDLRTGELREHRREDLPTQLCPTAFDPQAKCPTFERFLTEILPDADVRDFMRRLLGYCISGSSETHLLPILVGTGFNGKSTLMELVMAVLGRDFAAPALPGLLLTGAGERHPTQEAFLWGKRLVLVSELAEGKKLAADTVKRLTGGDTVCARRMREDPWVFPATHKIVLYLNHKPEVPENDDALWQRLRVIDFPRRFVGADQDRQLPTKLRAEAAGVLRWLVEGCLAWHAPGGQEAPEAVVTATEVYREAEDEVGLFLAERWPEDDPDEPETRGAQDLYQQFFEWARARGTRTPLTQKRFGERLKARGYDNRDKDPMTRRTLWRRPAPPPTGGGADLLPPSKP